MVVSLLIGDKALPEQTNVSAFPVETASLPANFSLSTARHSQQTKQGSHNFFVTPHFFIKHNWSLVAVTCGKIARGSVKKSIRAPSPLLLLVSSTHICVLLLSHSAGIMPSFSKNPDQQNASAMLLLSDCPGALVASSDCQMPRAQLFAYSPSFPLSHL